MRLVEDLAWQRSRRGSCSLEDVMKVVPPNALRLEEPVDWSGSYQCGLLRSRLTEGVTLTELTLKRLMALIKSSLRSVFQ